MLDDQSFDPTILSAAQPQWLPMYEKVTKSEQDQIQDFYETEYQTGTC